MSQKKTEVYNIKKVKPQCEEKKILLFATRKLKVISVTNKNRLENHDLLIKTSK